ncbi:MAG: hypothetical protein ACRDBG_10295 [Waterburya sp.]
MAGAGTTIVAGEGQTVQNKINSVVSLWGGAHPGTTNVGAGGAVTAGTINAWKSYLRTLSSRIAGNQVAVPGNSGSGSPIYWNEIQALYNSADQIYNWCNRSECNTSECNTSERDSGERDSSERNGFENY